MRHAGFVLVGGKSSRMGTDKALLVWNSATLAQHVARVVEEAAGAVALIGAPARYRVLGYPVYPDRWPECGPIGGIATALAVSPAEWSVVVGCDMPCVTPDLLHHLLREASSGPRRSIVPVGPSGPEPLCAVYHRDCLPVLEVAISAGRFKMRDVLNDLSPLPVTGMDPGCFANVNTPGEFEALAPK